MNKVYDNNKVAVLYHASFGVGWYSDHGIKELLFDPYIISLVQSKNDLNNKQLYDEAFIYLKNKYPDRDIFNLVDELEIEWIEVGTRFYIKDYDGSETIILENEIDWNMT